MQLSKIPCVKARSCHLSCWRRPTSPLPPSRTNAWTLPGISWLLRNSALQAPMNFLSAAMLNNPAFLLVNLLHDTTMRQLPLLELSHEEFLKFYLNLAKSKFREWIIAPQAKRVRQVDFHTFHACFWCHLQTDKSLQDSLEAKFPSVKIKHVQTLEVLC